MHGRKEGSSQIFARNNSIKKKKYRVSIIEIKFNIKIHINMTKSDHRFFKTNNFIIRATNTAQAKEFYNTFFTKIKRSKPKFKMFYWFVFRDIEGLYAEPIEKTFFDKLVSMADYEETIRAIRLALDTYFSIEDQPIRLLEVNEREPNIHNIIKFNKMESQWRAFEYDSKIYVSKTNAIPIKETELSKLMNKDIPIPQYKIHY